MSVGAWEPGEDEHEDETTCLLLVHPCTLLFFWIKTIKTSRILVCFYYSSIIVVS